MPNPVRLHDHTKARIRGRYQVTNLSLRLASPLGLSYLKLTVRIAMIRSRPDISQASEQKGGKTLKM